MECFIRTAAGIDDLLKTLSFLCQNFELTASFGVQFRKDCVGVCEGFVVDDRFRCEYLVGAGGTRCPVYRELFREANPRARIDTLQSSSVPQ